MFVSFWPKYSPENYKCKHHITKNLIKMKKLISYIFLTQSGKNFGNFYSKRYVDNLWIIVLYDSSGPLEPGV